MLLCAVCGKVIANVDPEHIRYGGCGKCDLYEVANAIEEKKSHCCDDDCRSYGCNRKARNLLINRGE